MKKSILFLSLIACLSTAIRAEEDINRSCSSSCCKKLTCQATPINNATVITESGPYCLTRDIIGTIEIAANNVTLDLNSHEVNADGNAFGITLIDVENVKVFNGTVSNSSDAGILVDPSRSIELSDLFMKGNQLDTIRVEDSHDILLHDINSTGTAGGNRTLLVDSCSNITVENWNITDYVNTDRGTALVQFESCDCLSVSDVNVCGNTKALSGQSGSFNLQTALIAVSLCTGVDFNRVKANNNILNHTAQGQRRALTFYVEASVDCSFTRCESSNNVDIAGNTGNNAPGGVNLTRSFLTGFCANLTITDHNSSDNIATQPSFVQRGFSSFLDSNLVYDGCRANNNIIPLAQDGESCSGFFLSSNAPFANLNTTLHNCQANGNGLISTFTTDDPFNPTADGISIDFADFNDGIVIDSCQANHNFINGNIGIISGLSLGFDTGNISIFNSSFDNNVGGVGANGIDLLNVNDIKILNCSASANGTFGISSNGVSGRTGISNDVSIINCICNNNGSDTLASAGILVNGKNNIIKGCQVNSTFSGVSAAGIQAENARNVVIEDTNVFDTTGGDSAHGILFNGCTDSKIINSQVHSNQNNGVELAGNSSNILLCGSIALNNGGHGFNLGTAGSDINSNSSSIEAVNCKSVKNGLNGFNASGFEQVLRSCISDLNSGSGYLFNPFIPFTTRVATDTDLENLNIYDGNYAALDEPNRLFFIPDNFLASTPLNLPINNVEVAVGDFVLVKNQDTCLQDGVYQAGQTRLDIGETLLNEAGTSYMEESPYLDFTLTITMSGNDVINITFFKNPYVFYGVDNCYFYPQNLVITNPPEVVEFPLETVPTGTILTGDSVVSNGLRWTAVQDGPWRVNDLTGEEGTQSSSDPAGTRVITCGFREPFSQYYSYGNSVAPFDNDTSTILLRIDDPQDGRIYTFDLLVRLSSEPLTPYAPEPDFLLITKNALLNPVWQLERVANWQEGDTVSAGTKVLVTESNTPNLTPAPVVYTLKKTVEVGEDAPVFKATQDTIPGQSRIEVDSCKAVCNSAHGLHNSAGDVTVRNTVCDRNGGFGFLDDSNPSASANANLYTRNRAFNNDDMNYNIDYVVPANPSQLQVGTINGGFPTEVAPEANVSLMP